MKVDILFSPKIRDLLLSFKGNDVFENLTRIVGEARGKRYRDSTEFIKDTELDYKWTPFNETQACYDVRIFVGNEEGARVIQAVNRLEGYCAKSSD